MQYYFQFKKPCGKIDFGYLQSENEKTARQWFMKNKPEGFVLREVRLANGGYRVNINSAIMEKESLEKKFKNK